MKVPLRNFLTLLVFVVMLGINAPMASGQMLEKLVVEDPAPMASLATIDVIRKAGIFINTVLMWISCMSREVLCRDQVSRSCPLCQSKGH